MMDAQRKQIKQFSDLLGETLIDIEVGESCVDGQQIVFVLENHERYRMFHLETGSETVRIEDIIGDLNDLLETPLLMAEKVSSKDEPSPNGCDPGSHTWTFYKLATIKGYVTIRWYGESNGYYSEEVWFEKIRSR